MKRAIVLTALVGTMAGGGTAQQVTVFSSDGRAMIEQAVPTTTMARVAVETRVTRGAPYTAEAVNEFVQVLADGNRIVRRTTTRIYRDSEGRTRREELRDGAPISIVITDPVEGVSLMLNPSTRTATRTPGAFGAVAVAGGRGGSTRAIVQPAAPAPRPDGQTAEQRRDAETRARLESELASVEQRLSVARAGGRANRQDLGQQTIEGIPTNGTRTTTVIPAGEIGNEQPITIISEQWFSNDLQVLVQTRHSDPRSGDTIYRLTNISRNEPDRSLFQVPADYTVRESATRRTPPPQ